MSVMLIYTLVLVIGLQAVVGIEAVDVDSNLDAKTFADVPTFVRVANKTYVYNFVDTNGTTLVLMTLMKNPIKLNFTRKVMKKGSTKPTWLNLGSDVLDSDPSSVTAIMDSADNSTGKTGKTITATLEFTDLGPNPNSTISISEATLVLTFQMGDAGTKGGYWNMSQASIDVKYINSSDSDGVPTKLHTDITPEKFGYTDSKGDQNCAAGYGVCAPLGLIWTCGTQKLSPANLTIANNTMATFVSLPGLALFPFPSNHSLTHPSSVYNWDCDPLIPISVWTGLLVSLGLASVVMWALMMLSYLPTPDRWDDPKKPGIYIPQTD